MFLKSKKKKSFLLVYFGRTTYPVQYIVVIKVLSLQQLPHTMSTQQKQRFSRASASVLRLRLYRMSSGTVLSLGHLLPAHNICSYVRKTEENGLKNVLRVAAMHTKVK